MKWEKEQAELIEEQERLCGELAKTRAERDAYLKSLYHAMCKDYVCPYTKEELLANAIFEPTMEDLLANLDRDQEA